MQRQSLGSPVAKLHAGLATPKHDTSDIPDDDKATKPRRFSASSSIPSPSLSLPPSPPKPEKLIHFIPLLTFICFLVLYLVSHTPSQSDLSQFSGFKLFSKHIDMSEVERLNEFRRGDVLATRSFRNLQEIPDRRSSHRKVAHF
ncbi:hypothetical protein K2173_002887 [Erythroxylum novogranatense]|uniref:Uncharacterized protein n=1 Tax=Erythroxylum novogranatense TaxID=1862640 RepID=A0AAV8SQ87_9ROSI|nr:hypothetical protein K2173_002887 [Erythroxylum novogranatense]